MSELKNIKSLEKYDQWKKVKRNRKSYIGLIANIISGLVGLLLTWAVLRVSVGDVWTCAKTAIASEEKIDQHWNKVQEVDNKLKKGILSKPLNFASKKIEEEAKKDFVKGNFKSFTEAARFYSIVIVLAWLVVWGVIWCPLYFLTNWIIGKYVWKEPTLSEQEIE